MYDSEKVKELEAEQKMVGEKKRMMQEINKKVWLDQIALNRMHKKLGL